MDRNEAVEAATALIGWGLSSNNVAVATAGASALYALASSELEFTALLNRATGGLELGTVARFVGGLADRVRGLANSARPASLVDWRCTLHVVTKPHGQGVSSELAEAGVVAIGKSQKDATQKLLETLQRVVGRSWDSYSRHHVTRQACDVAEVSLLATFK